MTILSLLLPVLALAASSELRLPEARTYAYQGSFEVLQKRVTEVVHNEGKGGLERIAELKKQGYACTPGGGNLVSCVGFVGLDGAEGEVQLLVDRAVHDLTVTFGAPSKDEPTQIVDGETYEEWAVAQPAVFQDEAFTGYRYQILQDGPHKLLFSEKKSLVVEEGGFSSILVVQKRLKRFVVATYIVAARLR